MQRVKVKPTGPVAVKSAPEPGGPPRSGGTYRKPRAPRRQHPTRDYGKQTPAPADNPYPSPFGPSGGF